MVLLTNMYQKVQKKKKEKKIFLENLRNQEENLEKFMERLRKMWNLKNSPVLEKTHRFLFSDTECIVYDQQFIFYLMQNKDIEALYKKYNIMVVYFTWGVKSYRACTRYSSGIISLSLMSCERDTEAVWWYSTSSFNELNFTTQRKNLPAKKEKKNLTFPVCL